MEQFDSQLNNFLKLEELWNLMQSNYKGSQKIFDSRLGLVEVPFYISLPEFASEHKKKSLENANVLSSFATSIDEVMNTVRDADIFLFHKSCVSDIFNYHGAALCILYEEELPKEHIIEKGIVLPGINFVFTYEKIDELIGMKEGLSNKQADTYRKATDNFLRLQEMYKDVKRA